MDYTTSYIFIKTKRETQQPRSHDESFLFFMKHSKIELVSDSSAYAFVLKCTFNLPENRSPYFYINSKGVMENLVTIALKTMLVVNSDEHPDKVKWYYFNRNERRTSRHYETKNNFFDEVEKQMAISELSIKKLNRNSPIILFSRLFTYESANYNKIKSQLLKNCINKPTKVATRQMFREFLNIQSNKLREHYYGIIAMEYVTPNYRTFCDIIKPIILDEIIAKPENSHIHKYDSLSLAPKSSRLRWAYNTARYEVLRMALDTGYTEGDYHTDNLLIDEKNRRTMIVDFGKAKQIDKKVLVDVFQTEDIDLFYDSLKNVLIGIFETNFSDEKENSAEFKWLKSIDIEDANIILFLHKLRTIVIEKNTSEIFDFYFNNKAEYVFLGNHFIDGKLNTFVWCPTFHF
jgi:hypothetical protein